MSDERRRQRRTPLIRLSASLWLSYVPPPAAPLSAAFSHTSFLKTVAADTPQVLQQLYEGDVMSEEALLAWAEEKEHADESDRVYLTKVGGLVEMVKILFEATCLFRSRPSSSNGSRQQTTTTRRMTRRID